ncbi:MAG: TVP38/TMEM64 family protein [Acidobacteriota bacterium]|nr:TVP38/TMEM64 family protein [Acidobacteriota bacterium]
MSRARLLIVIVLVAAMATAIWLLPVAQWTIALAERARAAGALGIVLFFAAYIVSTVAALPGAILTLAAGFAFGPVWGLAVASPASVLGATCAFLLGRTVLRGWAERTVANSPRARAIDRAVEREGLKLVLLLRLSPLFPFNVLNYALSLTRISLGRYVAGSAIGMLPGTALYVYLGSLAPAAAELSSAGSGGGTSRLAIYAAGLIATLAVVIVATRAARRALREELEGETA